MKKIFAMILCLSMVLSSFAGCGGPQVDDVTEPVVTTPIDAATEIIQSEETVATAEPTVEVVPDQTEPVVETEPVMEAPDADYYMATIHKAPMDEYGWTKLWFVIELQSIDSYIDPSSFKITNVKTNEVLTNDVNGETCKIEISMGSVCEEEVHSDFYEYSNPDRAQYTVCVDYVGDIDFEDLGVECYLDSNTTNLEFNAHISHITTYQKYVHGATLFEIDGYYYVANNARNVAGGVGESYNTYNIKYINGTPEQLLNSLNASMEYVYAPVLEEYFVDGIDDYEIFQHVTIPDGCVGHIGYNNEMFEVGLRSINGRELTDHEYSVSYVMIVQYTFDDGKTMTLIGF